MHVSDPATQTRVEILLCPNLEAAGVPAQTAPEVLAGSGTVIVVGGTPLLARGRTGSEI